MAKHLNKCPECGLSTDSWHHGNVCPDGPKLGMPHSQYEKVNPTKSNDRAFRTGWSVVKDQCCDNKRMVERKDGTRRCRTCGTTERD
jgi:hypothetical protein